MKHTPTQLADLARAAFLFGYHDGRTQGGRMSSSYDKDELYGVYVAGYELGDSHKAANDHDPA